MAGSDYCMCEVCGCKAFYDSPLWEMVSYDDDGPVYAGLCRECDKTHRLVAVPKEAQDDQ